MSKKSRKTVARVAAAAGMALAAGAANAITIDGPEGVGDFVWVDTNKDGIQDIGEVGLKDVTVKLRSGLDESILKTTTTDASGEYQFSWDNQDPDDDVYQITEFILEFIKPGYMFSPKEVGVDNTKDSDVNPTTGWTDNFNIYGPGLDTDSYHYDAGMYVVPVPAAVWLFGSGLLGLVGIARRKKAA